MSDRIPEELEGLLNALADGELDPGREICLAGILRGDAGARRHYRRFMAMHAALHWEYAAAAAPQATVRHGSRWGTFEHIALAASVVAAAILGGLLFRSHLLGTSPIVTVVATTGSLSWMGADGSARVGLADGVRVEAGTFETDGLGSSATLAFADGTTVVLGGETQADISQKIQKQIHLRTGTLSADVAPQPRGRPLIVRTPTAVIEVLGTTFSVAAEPEKTAISVQRGVVRMRRTADGQAVDVTADKAAVAILGSAEPMAARARTDTPSHWVLGLGREDGEKVRGLVMPQGDAGDPTPRIAARPYVAKRMADGTAIIRHGISVRGPTEKVRKFVAVGAGSVIRFRYRTARPAPVSVLISTLRQGRVFGGNFEMTIPKARDGAAPGEWRVAEIRADAMRPLMPSAGTRAADTAVMLLLISTASPEDGLEIADISVDSGP